MTIKVTMKLILFQILSSYVLAFTSPPPTTLIVTTRSFISCPSFIISNRNSIILMAKKRRRRKDKKDFQPVVQKENESIGSQEFEPKDGYDEEEEYLPDFVIKEDTDPVTTIGTPLPNPETSVVDANAPLTDTGTPKYPTTVDMNDPKVMERIMASMNDPKVMEMMRASKNSMAEKNTKELLLSRNRELEGSVLNDIKEDLPDLSEYMQNKQSFSPKTSANLGKKAARAESRRVAAIEAEEQERQEKEAAKGILSKLPFFKDKEGDPEEDLNPIKILEKGAWFGIFSLVAWEFYINSPLFDRAGPMAPVVFDKL